MRATAIFLLSAALAGPGIALAQTGPAERNPLVERLVQCRGQTDEAARVRCYDAAVDALSQATAEGSLVVVDREEVRKTRRSLFGFSLPKLPFFRGDDSQEEEEAKELEARIASARSLGNGKFLMVLDNGARWQNTDPIGYGKNPAAGLAIKIKKGALGAYFLSIDGGRAVKGMRVG